ncbi:MAG: hypothetical protein ACR2RF_26315 [Geminicoccaceae bacterium]
MGIKTLRQILALPTISVSKGNFGDVGMEFKFGFNAAVGTTEETIWSQGGLYEHPASASTMTVSSDDAADASAGTGARTIQIYGLDGDHLEVNEFITLNGLTAVTTTNSYLRMNRAVVRTVGSGASNAGVIYIGTGTVTSGVPADIFTTVDKNENQTLQALWTVPANKTAYVTRVIASSFGNANSVATIRFKARPDGESFQTKDKFLVTRGEVQIPHVFPIKFEEKTDMEMTGVADTGSLDVSASIEMLIENSA